MVCVGWFDSSHGASVRERRVTVKKLVRLTSALLAVTLLSVLCAIPAAAAELSGKATGS